MLVVVSVSCCDDVVTRTQSNEPCTKSIKLHGGQGGACQGQEEKIYRKLGERSMVIHARSSHTAILYKKQDTLDPPHQVSHLSSSSSFASLKACRGSAMVPLVGCGDKQGRQTQKL